MLAEYLLYMGITIYLASGRLDGILTSLPFVKLLGPILLSAIFIAVISFAHKMSYILTHTRTLFVLSLIVITGVHFTTPAGIITSYPDSPLYPFYYVLIITFASLGSGLLWLGAFSLFIVSEFGKLVSATLISTNDMDNYRIIIDQMIHILPHVGYVLAVGAVTYSVSTIRFINVKSAKIPPKSGINTIANKSNDGKAAEDKTSTYKIDEISGKNKTTNEGSSPSENSNDILIGGEELDSVVFFMSRNFRAYSALGFIFDAKKQVLKLNSFHSKSMSIIPEVQINPGEGIIGNIIIEKIPFLSGNVSNYSGGLKYYSQRERVNSILAVPILSSTDELLGALVIDSTDKLAFRDNHKEVLNRFSYLAAALINNVKMRLYEKRVADQFQIFYEAAQKFTTVQRSDQVLAILFQMIDSLTNYTRILAVDFNVESTSCTIRKVLGDEKIFQEGYSFPLNDGLFSTVLRAKKPIIIDEYSKFSNSKYLLVPKEQINPGMHSLIILPLAQSGSFCHGAIGIESTVPGYFQGEIGQLLSTLVSNAAVAYQKAFLYQKMELLATTDGLTQLCNHRTFQDTLHDEITRSLRYKRPLSLLLMDIDHFKSFNDTYGHQIGDIVLKEVAKCLVKTIRNNDLAARYGGEEFTIILPETDSRQAAVIGERIRQVIAAVSIASGNKNLNVTVSIGCASLPEHSTSQQQLINYADCAMYFSKENGRNKMTVYQKQMKVKKT